MKPFLLKVEREGGKLIGTVHVSAVKDVMEVFQFPPENRVGDGGWPARLEVVLRESSDGPVLP